MDKMDVPIENHHIGSTERVFVAHVNDLNDFYLHSELVRDSLIKLGQDLYNKYSEPLTTKSSGIHENLNIGDYCACPSESQDWYRGLIRQIDLNGTAVVFKIDHGDIACIPVQFLQPLHKNFIQQPCLAFHCSLANLIKPSEGWSSQAIDEFRSRLTTTFLYAKVINYNKIRDILQVEITEKASKVSLNEEFQQYQAQRLISPANDGLLYKHIPFENLDNNQSYQICMLYYISPSHFYVYLQDNMNSYLALQNDLQKVIHNLRPLSSLTKYQPVAVQDNHAIWHRAIIFDLNSNSKKIGVYFIDIGQREYVLLDSILPLPKEFEHRPAFALPSRLSNVYPLNSNDQSRWQSDDKVHDEFNRLMVNSVSCMVNGKQDQCIYDVDIDIPKLGDLATFLLNNKLVSRQTMNTSSRFNFNSNAQSFVRAQLRTSGMELSRASTQRSTQQNEYSNNSNNMPAQQRSTTLSNFDLSSNVSRLSSPDGAYRITQVHSATEFYGVSTRREPNLELLYKNLDEYYNNYINDQSFSVNYVNDNALYVAQHDDKYHRVLTKRRESETRVLVKFIDRGDEIIVDTSELLKALDKFASEPPFAEPFRLNYFDESQNSPTITRHLKKLILNQRVRIIDIGASINGFYPVNVILSNNQSVHAVLFPGDKNSSTLPSNNPPGFLQGNLTTIESKVFSNSSKHQSAYSQPSMGSSQISQRAHELLPSSSNFSSSTRLPPSRLPSSTNSITSPMNEQISRFRSVSYRNNQQQSSQTMDSPALNSVWNKDQNNKPNFSTANAPIQQSFGRQQPNSSQFGHNQRTDDSKTLMINTPNRFSSAQHDNEHMASEKRRPFDSDMSRDDRYEKQMSGNHFQKHDDGARENHFRRGSGFTSHGASFADREDRSGFHDSHTNRTNDNNNNMEPSSQFSSGFSRRDRGFPDRDRGGNSQNRNNFNRHQNDDYNENNTNRSKTFAQNHGGFQNRRDQGDNGIRGGRGGQRGGGFSSSRGGRDHFRERDNSNLQLSPVVHHSTEKFSDQSNAQSTMNNFEAGDKFISQEMPKGVFKFVVSQIETANEFFIQLLSKEDELTKFTDTLQNESNQVPEANLNSFRKDQPCLAKFTDNYWYRATVLETGSTQLKVYFVDFGNIIEVNSKTIRPLAKKHCLTTPYAYRCTLDNVQVVNNVNIDKIIQICAGKTFDGNIKTKTSDGKFVLESNDLLKLLLDINAIKLKSTVTLKQISCSVVHIESDRHEFFIQDDNETVEKISDLIATEEPNSSTLSLDEFKQLTPTTIVIAEFDDAPYRGIIQSEETDDNVNICFIDFGNTSSCSKTSLKRCSEQLSSYPYQGKQCQLYGVPSNKIDDAFKHLEEISDSKNLKISIVEKKENLHIVLLYVDDKCINEKFGCNPYTIESINEKTVGENNAAIITTTIEEQTSPTQLPDEEQIHDDILIQNKNLEMIKSETNESKVEETVPQYLQGVLTHIQEDKPIVYIQLLPESEPIMEQVNELVDKIVQDNIPCSSYNIGDFVIAQFSEDDNHYRAKIESCSSDLYTVYFLDYGNIDENVSKDHLYSYPNKLKLIEPQAQKYVLNEVTNAAWTNTIYSLIKEKLNDTIEFSITDKNNSIIHINGCYDICTDNVKESVEQTESSIIELPKIFKANISTVDIDYFYIHIVPEGNLRVCELQEDIKTCDKQCKHIWAIEDLCIVSNDENQFYRGQILDIDNDKYCVKCIDYGNKLESVKTDHLFVMPNIEMYQQLPLAHPCRLYGIDDDNQIIAINEIIRKIPITECVTINIENDRADPYWLVKLIRENHDVVNDSYSSSDKKNLDNENKKQLDNDNIISSNTSDSTNMDEQQTSKIDISQTETSAQSSDIINANENNSVLSSSNNQAIDVDENNPSRLIETIKDETNNSISLN